MRLISFLQKTPPPARFFLLSPLKLITSSLCLGLICFVFPPKVPGGCEFPSEPHQTGLLLSLKGR